MQQYVDNQERVCAQQTENAILRSNAEFTQDYNTRIMIATDEIRGKAEEVNALSERIHLMEMQKSHSLSNLRSELLAEAHHSILPSMITQEKENWRN